MGKVNLLENLINHIVCTCDLNIPNTKCLKTRSLQKKKRERRERYERKKELEVCKTSVRTKPEP